MANKNEYGPKRSPFRAVLYILVVLLLLGGIMYLVKCTRQKQAAFEDQIKAMDERENTLSENAAATEEEVVPQTSAWDEAVKTGTAENRTGMSTQTGMSDAESETESETESESEDEALLTRNILVLNGSGKDGMASKWQKELEKEGYQNVSYASFPGSAIEQTRIYAEKEEDVADLKKLFPEAEVTADEFTANITMEDGSQPSDIEVYIIIGKNDAEE